MKILLSEKCAAQLRPEIERVLAGQSFELIAHSRESGPITHQDFDLAFVSRDVTGKSTKHHLEPYTQAFHDALRNAPSLRWVQIHSAGTDRPIYPELMARGVTITTASGSHARVVAQSALAGILSLARRLPALMEQQRAKQWKSLVMAPPPDLEGQTVVIAGWGPIARALAEWLGMLGLKVVIVRNSGDPAAGHRTYRYAELADAAKQADWLVIACPLSEATRGMVDRKVLAAMPKGAHVVNVGRGEIVAEAELIEALEEGRLAGAYLDVFAVEPLPAASPLWSLPNVIVSPHSAGHSAGNEARVARIFLENLAARAAGKPLRNVAR